jgi:cytidyltransferase-like protein
MYKVVICSGYYNPVHCGHLDNFYEAAKLGNKLIIIVNNDDQVKIKGSVPFMDEKQRLRIISSLKPVDEAILSIDQDGTVVETLKLIYDKYNFARGYCTKSNVEMIFAKGGDRVLGNTPEEAFCNRVGIKTVYNVGGGKSESSSSLISNVQNKIPFTGMVK